MQAGDGAELGVGEPVAAEHGGRVTDGWSPAVGGISCPSASLSGKRVCECPIERVVVRAELDDGAHGTGPGGDVVELVP